MDASKLNYNGHPADIAQNNVQGMFTAIFRDGYYLADMGQMSDAQCQQAFAKFGQPWQGTAAEALLTVAKTEKPQFIAQTDEIIEAHNECAYHQTPPRLLAFYCVNNSAADGEFFVVSPEALQAAIGADYLPSLFGATYRCDIGAGQHAIDTTLVRKIDGTDRLIFTSIGCRHGRTNYTLVKSVDQFSQDLPQHLEAVLNQDQHKRWHRWRQGDFMVIDNHRLLHGREQFNGGERVLRHFRIR